MRICQRLGCERPLPDNSRSHRRWCSDVCRVMVYQAEHRRRLREFKQIVLHENLSRAELVEMIQKV